MIAQVWTPLLTRCAAKRRGREGKNVLSGDEWRWNILVRKPHSSNRTTSETIGLPSCIIIQKMIRNYCWIWTFTDGVSKLVPGSISPGIWTVSVADPASHIQLRSRLISLAVLGSTSWKFGCFSHGLICKCQGAVVFSANMGQFPQHFYDLFGTRVYHGRGGLKTRIPGYPEVMATPWGLGWSVELGCHVFRHPVMAYQTNDLGTSRIDCSCGSPVLRLGQHILPLENAFSLSTEFVVDIRLMLGMCTQIHFLVMALVDAGQHVFFPHPKNCNI